jgi:hypothetical protein
LTNSNARPAPGFHEAAAVVDFSKELLDSMAALRRVDEAMSRPLSTEGPATVETMRGLRHRLMTALLDAGYLTESDLVEGVRYAGMSVLDTEAGELLPAVLH